MNNLLVAKTAEHLVNDTNTESDLIALISFHSPNTNYGGRLQINSFDQAIARQVVKKAYQKLATFG